MTLKKTIQIFFIHLLVTTGVFADDEAYLTNIDNLTLQEVKEYLVRDQKSIEKFINFAQNNTLRFNVSDEEITKPSFNDKPYRILDTNMGKKKIDKFLSDTYFRQYIDYPASELWLHLDSAKMEDVFGAEKNSKDFPSIDIQSINYIDKSKEEVNRKAEWEEYNELYVDVNTSKPIDSMQVKISYTLPLVKEYFLSKQKPIVIKDGTIKIENMASGRVQISMSNDVLKERIIGIDAIHNNGKSLRKIGESMYSHPSKKNIAYMKKTNVLLKELVERIDNKSMFSSLFGKKSIDSIEALKKELKNIPKPTEEEEKQKLFWTYSFTGDIEKVRIVIGESRTEVRTKEFIVKRQDSLFRSSIGYYKARDTETKDEGLVGKNGKWLVQPKYRRLSFLNDYYYSDSSGQLYWLNTKKNILKPVKYELNEMKLYKGYLANVEKVVNGPEGIVNAKSGKLVIPMKYENIRWEKGFIMASLHNKKKYYEALFNEHAKEVIPLSAKYNRIEIFKANSIVATKKGEERYEDKIDFFDKKGKRFSSGKWNEYNGVFGKSKLLLVESWKSVSKAQSERCDGVSYGKKGYCQDKVAFINPKGKIILDASKYYEVKSFSNGMAAVRDKKTELWGYINTKGKLVIPYAYNQANYFQERLAYVRKGKVAYIIDKKNNIVKKLPDTYSSATISMDENNAIYHLYNGESYDANGTLIKKKQDKK